MLAYLSNIRGVGGELKVSPESFIVEELAEGAGLLELDKKVEGKEDAGGEGSFTHFVLQKKGWGTLDALRAIGKALGCGIRRFSYAGMKDRRALTTQLAGVFKIEPERVLGVRLPGISINGAWKAGDKVRMGSLKGNRFAIVLEGMEEGAEEKVASILADVGSRVPNYFGEQRFGIRGNNQVVGEHMVRGNLKGAVMEYLTGVGQSERVEAQGARKRLAEEKDVKAALGYFPKHLKYERTLLAQLEKNPQDYAGALRRFPRGLSLLFVHAIQSHLFNHVLNERIKSKEVTRETGLDETGNLIGYESKLTEHEERVLEKFTIKPEEFRMKGMPELGSKGTSRTVLAELQGFSFKQEGEKGRFRFTLNSGSYATSALREFTDVEKQE